MIKSLIAAAAVTLALSSAALAEDMMCDDASIMKAEEMAKGMTDPAMKDKWLSGIPRGRLGRTARSFVYEDVGAERARCHPPQARKPLAEIASFL